MGFMDELRKLTQPYDDEDDFFEGADSSLRQPAQPSAAQLEFENTFGEAPAGKPEPEAKPQTPPQEESGGLFSSLGGKKAAKPNAKPKAKKRERTVAFGGTETQVILFSPKTFDEAGELLNYLGQGRSVVMTLEGVPTETARRLLDFLSGVTYALQGRITPISAKTYFITPQNVDVVGAQSDQPENESYYL
ncbi:MAG: cell division protein SepF [Oscillospiraceae bacterium]|nr:cell division protein SepF [Oscillospiraceae bacterium]